MANERREPGTDGLFDDRRLGELLRSLSRETSRPGFASRVIARLDERRPSSARWFLGASVAAGFAALIAGAVLSHDLDERRRLDSARRALAQIRSEHRAIAAEIEQIRQLPVGRDPGVLYLGGDDQADYFVDLSSVDETQGQASVPQAARNRS